MRKIDHAKTEIA